jgi:hypothetical protein
MVELHGRAKPAYREPVTAPITQRECCWFSYSVASIAKKKNEIPYVALGSGKPLLFITDNTGVCLVDMDEVTKTAIEPWERKLDFVQLPDFIRQAVEKDSPEARVRKFKVTESIIRIDDPVVAVGRFQTLQGAAAPSSGLGKDAMEIAQAWLADESAALDRWDENRDGKLDAGEREKVGAAAWREAAGRLLDQRKKVPLNVLRRPTSKELPCLLGVGDEIDVLDMVRKSMLAVWLQFGIVLLIIAFVGGPLFLEN